MKTLVVDASVVVKWFVEEPDSTEALRILHDHVGGRVELHAPNLLPYEVLNALKYTGEFGEEDLTRAGRALEDLQVTLHPLEGSLLAETVTLALRKGITIYDASYAALAQSLNTTLYTADEKLMRRLGGNFPVRHLRDYDS